MQSMHNNNNIKSHKLKSPKYLIHFQRRAIDDRSSGKKRKSNSGSSGRSRSNSSNSITFWSSPQSSQSPTLNSGRNRLNIAPLRLSDTTPANSPSSHQFGNAAAYGSPASNYSLNSSISCSPTLGLPKFLQQEPSTPTSVSSSLSKSPGESSSIFKWAVTNDRNNKNGTDR